MDSGLALRAPRNDGDALIAVEKRCAVRRACELDNIPIRTIVRIVLSVRGASRGRLEAGQIVGRETGR
ncbi:hypothetical protein D1920_09085 [Rhodopseudomonas palustris]|nr:hypothetical protein D1920_09085 [Rhodopseudomonas palustris]